MAYSKHNRPNSFLLLKGWLLAATVTIAAVSAHAAEPATAAVATAYPVAADTSHLPRFVHRVGLEMRPAYILPSNRFLRGNNLAQRAINASFSAHLRYAFQPHPGTCADRIYGGAYQGIGLAYYDFGSAQELGSPLAVYLFQGGRIARLAPRLSLNYEWNFGLSFGWKPYDEVSNPTDCMVGSKINAYIDINLYLCWMLSPQIDLTAGLTLTHFSNGNTKYPNAGLNDTGLKLGFAYNFNRHASAFADPRRALLPRFRRHISYDLTLFGSWRRKGVPFGDKQVASPETYPVAGINFAAMYNFGYKFRAGLSLDGIYDGSANIYTEDYIVGTEQQFHRPALSRQIALGLSARAEFVMPYFTIGLGLGRNIVHRGGDLDALYQMFTLKVGITRSSYLHIGYSLLDFQTPNFLMLGIGYRFNNRYPRLY